MFRTLFSLASLPLRLFVAAIIPFFCVTPVRAHADKGPYSIIRKAANQQTWAATIVYTNTSGAIAYKTNSYTELATGLNHLVNGQWVQSSEEIQITASGGAATNTPHQVYFAANINGPGSIDILTKRGARVTGTILGLSLYDRAIDKNVVIAQVRDSIGQVMPTLNQVLYTNALADNQSDFSADVLYTHKRSGFEQDVILHQRTPDPVALGMNPATTTIQVWTEFYNTHDPLVSTNKIWTSVRKNGRLEKETMADETLDFGGMRMGKGRAFQSGGMTNTTGDSALLLPVAKHWVKKGGQRFLVEEVPFNSVVSQLSALPASSPNGNSSSNNQQSFFKIPSKQNKPQSLMLAKVNQSVPSGFVLDYNTIDTDQPDFTFQSDSTYYISSYCHLTGVTTIEGGTVIKVAGGGATLEVDDNEVNWKTAPCRPAIFTVTDDDSVGAIISGSSGTPSLAIDSTFLYCLQGGTMHDARFCYAWNAYSGCLPDIEIRDCQFINCDNVVVANFDTITMGLHNVLITMNDAVNNTANYCGCNPAAIVLITEGITVNAENVTFNLGTQYLVKNYDGNPNYCSVNLANCIVITPNIASFNFWDNAPDSIPIYSSSSLCLAADTGAVFQTVGAAAYYLADNSPARHLGVTSISSSTLKDINSKTTYPPLDLGLNHIFTDIALYPQVQRDTNSSIDAGYHYDPIDYAIQAGIIDNVKVQLLGGATIAFYDISGTGESPEGTFNGLTVSDGGVFYSEGSPTNPNRLIWYNLVQEPSAGNWTSQAGFSRTILSCAQDAQVNCRFTDFDLIQQYGDYILNDDAYNYGTSGQLNFRDCEFGSGALYVQPGDDEDPLTATFTNCLFLRSSLDTTDFLNNYSVFNLSFVNNSYFGGLFHIEVGNGTYAVNMLNNFLCDSIFLTTLDGGSAFYGFPASVTAGHNAYTTATVNSWSMELYTDHTSDVFVAGGNFFDGPLGRFYIGPTDPLVNAGNTSADQLGFYEYTTQTSQAKEAASPIDIGYHYVATDVNGNPDSTLWLGQPDYLLDADGNGLPDLVNWENAHFGHIGIDPHGDPDGDGLGNLMEYENGTDPNVSNNAIPSGTPSIPFCPQ